jgi:CheY-like chemotaxis protein
MFSTGIASNHQLYSSGASPFPIRITVLAKTAKVSVGNIKEFGSIATSLARNPLGIIALFIVLVYGFASLVTAFGGSLTSGERAPLIYFLVCFPVLVLAVFAWLVSSHSGKLFAPSDFRDEENYVKMQLSAVASLTRAVTKQSGGNAGPESEISDIVEVVQHAIPSSKIGSEGWRNHILWVDDNPDNNIYERQAFEAVGLRFTLALSTKQAFKKLEQNKFAAVISDMGRREGAREGYALLDGLRRRGDQTPFFIYASSNAPEHKQETLAHEGQGTTNSAQELFQMVTRAVLLSTPS